MLKPAQLRDLMSSKALDCSQGWLVDQLGWQGENATLRVSRLCQDGAEIPLTTAKHIVRIAKENGYELVNGRWEIAWSEITPDNLRVNTDER